MNLIHSSHRNHALPARQRIGIVEKPQSILHALEFFRDMPALLRATRSSEVVGARRWHKLKRGGMRIYVRMEPDGRLFFHLFCRRDWKSRWVRHAA
jgi:hypothetical protein